MKSCKYCIFVNIFLTTSYKINSCFSHQKDNPVVQERFLSNTEAYMGHSSLVCEKLSRSAKLS